MATRIHHGRAKDSTISISRRGMSILDNMIDEHVRRTCYCQEAADSTRDVIAKEIAGIRREAKVEALREGN